MIRRVESEIIDFTRILIMGGVVLIHCNISSYLGDSEGVRSAGHVIDFISGSLCSVCVPMFFFISGLLFFKDWTYSFSSYKNKFKRRVKSLLIPYLIWCSIGVPLYLIKASPIFASIFPAYVDATTSFPKILEGFWSLDLLGVPDTPFPFDFSLWFVRDLLICVMLVPLLQICFKLSWGWLILAVIISRFNFYGIGDAILYFSFGALCSIKHVPFISFSQSRKIWIPALFIFVAVKLVGFIWISDIIAEIKPVVLTFGFVGLFGLAGELSPMLRYPLVQRILSSLFFVYAFHALWVTVFNKTMVALIAPQNLISSLACYLGLFLIQWIVGISLFSILQRYVPSFVSIITGGRSTSLIASNATR